MKKLKVEIDGKSGFCFGVTSAIKKAEEVLSEGKDLYCLGEIVHNEEENERLRELGLKTIEKPDFESLKDKTVMFRAHGEPPISYETAEKNNLEIVDASCPIILKFHKRIKSNYTPEDNVYIFGKHNHPEIIALNGQIGNNATIFEDISELDIEKLPRKIVLYSQTTKSIERYFESVDILEKAGIEVQVNDTICRQVSKRQPNLIEFASKFDVIIFVAGKNSSNGKVLYNVCKKQNVNTYFISNPDELNSDWFKENNSVGICGATSTPLWIMEKTKSTLLDL